MIPSVLVDSNVLIDLMSADPVWSVWSSEALERSGTFARLVINPIIYAEVSVAFAEIEALDRLLPPAIFAREELPWEAGFLAGKAHFAYRRRGGHRGGVLPDFYIGAHAAVAGYRVLTRDRRRFATYFPTVALITP